MAIGQCPCFFGALPQTVLIPNCSDKFHLRHFSSINDIKQRPQFFQHHRSGSMRASSFKTETKEGQFLFCLLIESEHEILHIRSRKKIPQREMCTPTFFHKWTILSATGLNCITCPD